jgi:hypothetical protein
MSYRHIVKNAKKVGKDEEWILAGKEVLVNGKSQRYICLVGDPAYRNKQTFFKNRTARLSFMAAIPFLRMKYKGNKKVSDALQELETSAEFF